MAAEAERELAVGQRRPGDAAEVRVDAGAIRHRGPMSLLTWRILALNVLALGMLVAGLLFIGDYRDGLIEAKIEALTTQAAIISGALGESALADGAGPTALDTMTARQMVRRMAEPAATRALLFALDGDLLADSRRLAEGGRLVETRPLGPPTAPGWALRQVNAAYDWIVGRSPWRPVVPAYREAAEPVAADFPEAMAALQGQDASGLRLSEGTVILTVAVPVQGFKQIVGALMLQTNTADVDASVRAVRLAILGVSALALGVTVLLSLYLAGTIARPIRRLAEAAQRVQHGKTGRVPIPDFTRRRDEIGDLSGALHEMTIELYQRVDAIEAFAADVAHELKNPLTSLRSAIEGIEILDDEAQRLRLIGILKHDIGRIDRLITEISGASRLDAELSRAEFVPVQLDALLKTLVEVYGATAANEGIDLRLELGDGSPLVVDGIEHRLGQIARNLVDNAVSFSPPDTMITVRANRTRGVVRFSVEDEGPGLPEDALDHIFERFYTERRRGEQFGLHSGLGLSICRSIAEAHGGTIRAENRRGSDGEVLGARFVVELPASAAAARR